MRHSERACDRELRDVGVPDRDRVLHDPQQPLGTDFQGQCLPPRCRNISRLAALKERQLRGTSFLELAACTQYYHQVLQPYGEGHLSWPYQTTLPGPEQSPSAARLSRPRLARTDSVYGGRDDTTGRTGEQASYAHQSSRPATASHTHASTFQEAARTVRVPNPEAIPATGVASAEATARRSTTTSFGDGPRMGGHDTRTSFAAHTSADEYLSSREFLGEESFTRPHGVAETEPAPVPVASHRKIPAQTPSRAVQEEIWQQEKAAASERPAKKIPSPSEDPEGFLRYMQENMLKPVQYTYVTRYVDHILIPDSELSIEVPRARGMHNY
eukprot:COSAG01_NODE_19173_length_1026_cov_1.449838_1_plen_327_part_01